jgi:AraC family transcriptional regulator
MESVHNQAFHAGPQPFGNVVEANLTSPVFDVRVQRTHWQHRGEGTFQPSMCFIEMFLTSKQVRGTFLSNAVSHHRELGNVSFIPERAALSCSWEPGIQRCLSCMFDIRALCERTALQWTWPHFDLEAALNIRNEYVSLGLRRIAEELLSPGFASEQQIECSLMFIAMELRRHFGSDERTPAATRGCLTAGQLTLLNEMMIDSSATPTIAELAAACSMGGRQLAQAYRRSTGVTLRSFMAKSRLDRAKMQLFDDSILIKQIAYDAGFRSAAAFTAAFHKATGRTPLAFRAAKIAALMH